MQDEDGREARARARAGWPVAKYRLGEEPGDAVWAAMTPGERVGMVWSLTVDAWALSGREMPDYDRAHTPSPLFRAGERAPDDESGDS